MLFHVKSIKVHPSVIGYVAKFVALFGKGKTHEGYRICDIAFERFHSSHATILLLIKVSVPWFRTGSFSSSFALGCRPVHNREA